MRLTLPVSGRTRRYATAILVALFGLLLTSFPGCEKTLCTEMDCSDLFMLRIFPHSGDIPPGHCVVEAELDGHDFEGEPALSDSTAYFGGWAEPLFLLVSSSELRVQINGAPEAAAGGPPNASSQPRSSFTPCRVGRVR